MSLQNDYFEECCINASRTLRITISIVEDCFENAMTISKNAAYDSIRENIAPLRRTLRKTALKNAVKTAFEEHCNVERCEDSFEEHCEESFQMIASENASMISLRERSYNVADDRFVEHCGRLFRERCNVVDVASENVSNDLFRITLWMTAFRECCSDHLDDRFEERRTLRKTASKNIAEHCEDYFEECCGRLFRRTLQMIVSQNVTDDRFENAANDRFVERTTLRKTAFR
ncbi:unnamed protein product [Sphenostylis stenocarpa]|uniref:Uncharacterized protein n=1 Tax=Sphenostylis stenocarpa TaxID=92480 RepID=A0AA86RSR7_9FABA|nr:unnamed protein product [Sphenostylis stenocarpa]